MSTELIARLADALLERLPSCSYLKQVRGLPTEFCYRPPAWVTDVQGEQPLHWCDVHGGRPSRELVPYHDDDEARALLAEADAAVKDESKGSDEEELRVYSFEPDETELVREITQIVRDVDRHFQEAGGTSRHWVRDHFLPELRSNGWRIVRLKND